MFPFAPAAALPPVIRLLEALAETILLVLDLRARRAGLAASLTFLLGPLDAAAFLVMVLFIAALGVEAFFTAGFLWVATFVELVFFTRVCVEEALLLGDRVYVMAPRHGRVHKEY